MSHIAAMTREQLIQSIADYAKQANLSPATVTKRAVDNSRLFQRLLDGNGCTLKTAERLRAYMASHPPKTPEAAR